MIRKEHREEKWNFAFVEYVCEESEKKLPLIIQLHGAGERGNGTDELDKVLVHGFPNIVNDENLKDCILIMPQCACDSFWVARIESIKKFIDRAIEEFSVDTDRVYLCGISMGGYGTWNTAMAFPDMFAAIAPCCGGGMAWNAGVLTMPVWAWHGAEDGVVSPVQSDEMVESLKAQGKDVTYSRVEGVGHNVWENAYTEELLNWFLSKKR